MKEGAHLTTSRVNRLLRPLGNKCNALAALPKSGTVSHVAYSKQSSCWDPDSRPPLAVLCRSAGTKKLTLDRHSVDEFELSRRIYAVYDAFKNVVHVAYHGHPFNEHVPTLATMCALVIGENMPVENSGSTLADSGEETHEINILSSDDIYEAVPPHCYRFLIVSHALSLILCICAHHHTLVTILLDHCLSAGLVHESTRLLNIILAQAFLSSNLTFLAPVTHPAHTNYLVDLHAKWTAGNKASGSSLLFTTSTFCQMVLDTLSHSTSNSYFLWDSKALDKFIHAVEGYDTDSYIVIIRALSWSFRDALGSSSNSVQDVQLAALRDKLCKSMSNLFDLLFVQPVSHSSPLPLSTVQATIDMIYDCHSAQLHRLRIPTSGSPIGLPDIMTVFATHILVVFRDLIDNSDHLLTILDDSTLVPTTFTKLVVYFSRPQGSRGFGDLVEVFLSELNKYSFTLRAEKLFALDASLWACGLHHFETSITISQKGDSTLIARYKLRLMEAVDAAERRCFGRDTSSSPVISSICSTHAKRAQHGRPSGHWEWEDMVDSWIRKTPMRKKRKIENDCLHTPSRHGPLRIKCRTTSEGVSEPSPFSTPLSIQHRCSSTFSLSSPSRIFEREYRTEDGSEYRESDKENCAGSSASTIKASKRVKRQSSNFFSLLADAQTNRIVLHSNRRSKPKPPHSIILERYALPSSQEPWHTSHQYKQPKANDRKISPLPAPSRSLLLSDDLLDLFACATSSPARC